MTKVELIPGTISLSIVHTGKPYYMDMDKSSCIPIQTDIGIVTLAYLYLTEDKQGNLGMFLTHWFKKVGDK